MPNRHAKNLLLAIRLSPGVLLNSFQVIKVVSDFLNAPVTGVRDLVGCKLAQPGIAVVESACDFRPLAVVFGKFFEAILIKVSAHE